MSAAMISKWFNAAIVKAIRTDSLDTTLAYVIAAGGSVVWPPATRRHLRCNDPIFISNTIWQFICWKSGGIPSPSFRTSNATRTFFISRANPSLQKVVPVRRSISKASFTVFGRSIPNLWVLLWYRLLRAFAIIRSRRCKVGPTHQAKAGYWSILFDTAYSAVCTG